LICTRFTTGLLHLPQGETAEEAMARELEEETGLALNALAEPHLRPCGRVYVRYTLLFTFIALLRAPLLAATLFITCAPSQVP
jgi:8-oxo-dGTP pyrophosphatase MutT (NUDIX family)